MQSRTSNADLGYTPLSAQLFTEGWADEVTYGVLQFLRHNSGSRRKILS
jgi:hypothetical protein